MVVYLGEGVAETRAQELLIELRALPGVEHAELVPPAESAKRLQAALGADTTLLEGIEVGSLPASVEVTLAPGVRDVVAISPTVRALRGAPGVDGVTVDDGDDDKTAAAMHAIRYVAWGGAAMFAGLALIIVLASIRVRLDRTKNELAVAELLGAGPTFFVIPTALAGAFHGALAALLAIGALFVGAHVYGDAIIAGLEPSLGTVELLLPGGADLALFIAASAGLGLVGGTLAGASRASR